MSYKISIIDRFGTTYETVQNTFLHSQHNIVQEYFDVNSYVLNNAFIFDDETTSITLELIISNNFAENTPIPKTQKFLMNIGPSILFNETKNFIDKLVIRMLFSETNNEYIFSSDYEAFSGENNVVGVIFSEDNDFISSYLSSTEVKKKFVLAPKIIKPKEQVRLTITFSLSDEFSSEIRNKAVPFDQALYDLSKIYITLIEQNDNINLRKFYEKFTINSTYFLLERNALVNAPQVLDLENFLFYVLNLNGVRFQNDGVLKKYLLFANYDIVNNIEYKYEYVNQKIFPNLLLNFDGTNYWLETTASAAEISLASYVEKVIIYTILDMFRPYFVLVNYSPKWQNNNTFILCQTIISLLNDLKNHILNNSVLFDSVTVNLNYTGNPLDLYTAKLLYNALFLYATFYVGFANRLYADSLIDDFTNSYVSQLVSFLNEQENINLYRNNVTLISNYIVSYSEDTLIPVLILLSTYFLFVNYALFSDTQQQIFLFDSLSFTPKTLLDEMYLYFHNFAESLNLKFNNISLDLDKFTVVNVYTNINFLTNFDLTIKQALCISILDIISTIQLPEFLDSRKFNYIKLKDNLLNYVKFLYNIFSNISSSIVLVDNQRPNSYDFNNSILNLHTKLTNILTFIQNINFKYAQNSIVVKFIFNDTLI